MDNTEKQEIQALFLEETEDYLHSIESSLLGMGNSSLPQEDIDKILRAAHSIKGGAAMMGFQKMSDIAHRLEDYFKIIKGGRITLNDQLERLFLQSVDGLRGMIPVYREGKTISSIWIQNKIEPILDNLYQQMGDLRPEDEEAILAIKNQGDEGDMSGFLFETEVESILTDLEEMLNNKDEISLIQAKLSEITLELGGLAEMLELSNFSLLCQSIDQSLQDHPDQLQLIIDSSIKELRRSQALVLAHQPNLIPTKLNIDSNINTVATIKPQPLQTESLLKIEESLIEISESNQDFPLDDLKLDRENDTLNIEIETATVFSSEDEDIFSPSLNTKEIPSQSLDYTVRVSARQIQELGDLFGELTIEKNGLDLQLKNLRNILSYLRQKVRHLETSNFKLRTLYDQISIPSLNSAQLTNTINSVLSPTESFDLLEIDRYNDLHLVSGEIMENVVQIQEATNDFEIYLSDTEKLNIGLNRTSKLMQNNLNKIKMRPLSDLLKSFPRALRDMEIQYNKRVELETKGGGTLLEKNVLDNLNEPLLHLFRNAFDHGIEDKETRKKLGKPEIGKIEISAAYRGKQTIITIADDGKGINLDKIREKAKKMGLTDEDLAQTPEKELLELIFEAGFSTSEKVTDLSGRGVGMDVVRKNVENIGGDIMVETKAGQGTKFILAVPFTLSVVRVLLVEVNKMLLAFPSNSVEEVNLFEPEILLKKDEKEFINLEEEQEKIPLIRLDNYFKFAHSLPVLETEDIPIINEPTLLMIENENQLIGLIVDRYWGEQEVTIRQVEGNLPMPPGFSNCTILGDGRVVPLIDAIGLLNWIEKDQKNQFNSSQDNLKFNDSNNSDNLVNLINKKNIMVIDDSINVRRFLTLTFSQANYHVEQAKDGQDALEKIETGIPIDAIICDIEMPRLDGYGFLAKIKSDSAFNKIPVIMLTSRSGDKHRKLAMNLGANAYFSKPFKERELLGLVDNLVNS